MDHSGHGMDMNMDLPPFTLGRGLEFSFDAFFLFGSLLGLALYGWGCFDCGGAGTTGRWAAPSPSASAC